MKSMNLKRFASTVMAAVLALALAVPAFATNATNITGTYRAITLAVTVPTTGSAIINPYGLPYELGEGVSISGQQITTGAPLLIQNKSAVPLSVSASATGTVKGDFLFSPTDPTTASPAVTTKSGLVKVQMFPAAGIKEDNATDTATLNQNFAALPDDSADPAKDIVVSTTANEVTDIITLKAGNAAGELVDGGAAFFRLSGTVVKKPATPWAAADGFTVKIAFTFEPTVEEAEAGTLAATKADGTALTTANTIGATTDTTAKITLTPSLPQGVTVADWTWASSDTDSATIAENTPDTSATLTYAWAGSTIVSVSGMGSDGKLYTASITITTVNA